VTLAEIEAEYRRVSQDVRPPYKLDQAAVYRLANEAEQEACRRSKLLIDSTTVDVTQIDVSAGDWLFDLDPRIIWVRRAKLANWPYPLIRRNLKWFDEHIVNWENLPAGRPLYFFTDYETGKLAVYPKSLLATTAHITVARMPLADMTQASDSPEIRPRYHMRLADWILYRFFVEHGTDVEQEKKAVFHLGLFESEFGKRPFAEQEEHPGFEDAFESNDEFC
jgi:hypothetical protein